MCFVVIFAAGPVRHMSVPAGPRAGETTGKHGQRPYGRLAGDLGRRLARACGYHSAVKQQASSELDPARAEHLRMS